MPRRFTEQLEGGALYPSHRGIDHYRRYEEDIQLFAEMGFKMYRMSINWTRIFPNGDDEEPNQAGLEHYRRVFQLCRRYGIEPLVTMSHYEFPFALTKKWNGWADRRTIGCFTRYTETIMREYKGLVRYWLTFNEINIAVLGVGDTVSCYEAGTECPRCTQPPLHGTAQSVHSVCLDRGCRPKDRPSIQIRLYDSRVCGLPLYLCAG